jgi:hypothetical protein
MQIHKILFSTYGRKITKLERPLETSSISLWSLFPNYGEEVHQIKEAFGDFIHKLVKSLSHLWWRGHQSREAFGDFINKLVKSLDFPRKIYTLMHPIYVFDMGSHVIWPWSFYVAKRH